MTSPVRLFLSVEAVVFIIAALLHAGVLLSGFEHLAAQRAESVIAVVLLSGLAGTAVAPAASRGIGLAAQGFALLGTLVGAVMIAIGVGPGTTLDVALHTAMIALLVSGCVVLARHHAVA